MIVTKKPHKLCTFFERFVSAFTLNFYNKTQVLNTLPEHRFLFALYRLYRYIILITFFLFDLNFTSGVQGICLLLFTNAVRLCTEDPTNTCTIHTASFSYKFYNLYLCKNAQLYYAALRQRRGTNYGSETGSMKTTFAFFFYFLSKIIFSVDS